MCVCVYTLAEGPLVQTYRLLLRAMPTTSHLTFVTGLVGELSIATCARIERHVGVHACERVCVCTDITRHHTKGLGSHLELKCHKRASAVDRVST